MDTKASIQCCNAALPVNDVIACAKHAFRDDQRTARLRRSVSHRKLQILIYNGLLFSLQRLVEP